MTDWLQTLRTFDDGAMPCVLVTLAAARGSTPREAGAKFVVTAHGSFGTIGGGQLEYECIDTARELLEQGATTPCLRHVPLGPALGQCCGGAATLVFEPLRQRVPAWAAVRAALEQRSPCVVATVIEPGAGTCVAPGGHLVFAGASVQDDPGAGAVTEQASDAARALLHAADGAAAPRLERLDDGTLVYLERVSDADLALVLFGAGHVGKALVQVLSAAPCRVTWVDPRRDIFPAPLPANVHARGLAPPHAAVDEALPGSAFLVMTHSHALDLELCERVLRRTDFAYLGLIGSMSKRRRFEKRLRASGLAAGLIERMVCPIGIDGIVSKHPGAIAVAVAAQLLQVRERLVALSPQAPAAAGAS